MAPQAPYPRRAAPGPRTSRRSTALTSPSWSNTPAALVRAAASISGVRETGATTALVHCGDWRHATSTRGQTALFGQDRQELAMTMQSSSFFAVLSAAGLLLVSGNATSAHSHKNSGPAINGPVHGPGSSHNPIVYRPVHGQGSTHNPIVRTNHPKPGPCGVNGRPGDCHPICRAGPHGECIPL